MKIENSNDNNQLERLNKELRNKIQDKEAEIKAVDQYYDQKISSQREAGENTYLTSLDQNQKRLINVNNDAENKLKEYQENLNRTKSNLEFQENQLKDNYIGKEATLKNQSENKLQDLYINSRNIEEQIKNKTNNEVKTIDQKSHQQISNLKQETARNLNKYAINYANLSNDTENDFRNKLTLDLKMHRDELIKTKEEFQKNLDIETKKNERLGNEKLRVQKDELDTLDKFHKNIMDQKISDFKIRYEKLTAEHEQLLNDLKTKLDSESLKLKQQNTVAKKNIEDRFKDPFYKLETIEPNLFEKDKDYFVSIKVPEHEKENVNLVAHGRTIKLTLSKKFNEIMPEENGAVNRSSKTQLYSKEMQVKDLMNPKGIQAKYEDGLLTYKISKA